MPGLTSFVAPVSRGKKSADTISSGKQVDATRDDASVDDLCRLMIDKFFKRTGISIRGFTLDLDGPVGTHVRSIVDGWNLGGVPTHYLKKFTVTGISMATMAYSHTRFETQVHIALFTILLLCVDDLEIDPSALLEFVPRLQTGTHQLHPVLELLVERLRMMPEFFSPYASSAILSGIVHFINESAFEKETEAIALQPASYPYVLDKRMKNGLSEVYSACAWEKFDFPDARSYVQVLPDTMSFLDYSNDILSFYKEEIAGEKANLVHDLANVMDKSIEDVLEGLLGEVVHAVERGREVLRGEKERATWEKLLAGWVAFHFVSPRYRLATLTDSNYL